MQCYPVIKLVRWNGIRIKRMYDVSSDKLLMFEASVCHAPMRRTTLTKEQETLTLNQIFLLKERECVVVVIELKFIVAKVVERTSASLKNGGLNMSSVCSFQGRPHLFVTASFQSEHYCKYRSLKSISFSNFSKRTCTTETFHPDFFDDL